MSKLLSVVINFFKTIFPEHIVSNSLDLNLVLHYVRPDLGPNSLQMLSADDTRMPRVLCVHMNKK